MTGGRDVPDRNRPYSRVRHVESKTRRSAFFEDRSSGVQCLVFGVE